MIGAVVNTLEAENGERVSGAQGRLLHGALFALLGETDARLSARLHDGPGVKPFAIAPLELPEDVPRAGSDRLLRAGLLDETELIGACLAVPTELGKEVIDFSDSMFGTVRDKKSLWGSRVFFEDAFSVDKDGNPSTATILPASRTHPLVGPNPTSFQFYLEQAGNVLKNWDTKDAKIRGYKLFWNVNNPDWKATDGEIKNDMENE